MHIDDANTGAHASRALRRRIKRTHLSLAALIPVACTSALVSVVAVAFIVTSGLELIEVHARNALDVERLDTLSQREARVIRGRLLTLSELSAHKTEAAREEFDSHLASMRERNKNTPEILWHLQEIADATRVHRLVADEATALALFEPAVAADLFEQEVMAQQAVRERKIRDLGNKERSELVGAKRSLRQGALIAAIAVVIGALAALVFGLTFAVRLRRATADADRNLDLIEQANRDLDAFAGRVAHDLKAILAPVTLSLPSLAQVQDERTRQAVHRIERSVERMVALVDALLLFARAGRTSTDGSTVIGDALRGALESVELLRTEVDAEIVIDDCKDEVCCASPLLFEVFVNLLTNALKHLRDCEERRILVSCRAEDGQSEIHVADTGPGVPADALASLGQPFFRVSSDRTPGTGIGLATVTRIVEAAGGRVRFESPSQGGFHVYVTLARVLAPSEERARSEAVPARAGLRRRHV